MIVIADYPVDEILALAVKKDEYQRHNSAKKSFNVNGKSYKVNMNSDRYALFAKSCSCVVCGIVGTIMRLEKSTPRDNAPHFNLYAKENGLMILMTKDHILPKSKGGKDQLDNYQVMCTICNQIKGHYFLDLESLRKLRQQYDVTKDIGEIVDSLLTPSQSLNKMFSKRGKLRLKNEESAVNKSLEPCLRVAGTLRITEIGGELFANTKESKFMHTNNKIGEITQGEFVVPLGCRDSFVIVKLPDYKYCLVPQSYLKKVNDVDCPES